MQGLLAVFFPVLLMAVAIGMDRFERYALTPRADSEPARLDTVVTEAAHIAPGDRGPVDGPPADTSNHPGSGWNPALSEIAS